MTLINKEECSTTIECYTHIKVLKMYVVLNVHV